MTFAQCAGARYDVTFPEVNKGGWKMALRAGGRVVEPVLRRYPERCLSAAVLQGLAVVSLCTAVGDPSWLLVQAGGQSYVYGVAYTLHRGFNLTETGSLHLLHDIGSDVLVLMTTFCYTSILMGFAAFLLDFLETRNLRLMGVKIAPLLHFTTVLSTAVAVGLCSYLFAFILQEVQSFKVKENSVEFGESYFFAIFSGVSSLIAGVLSYIYSRRYSRQTRIQSTHTVQTEDVTSPLLQQPSSTDLTGEYG
ncbi:transmembrane protein 127-like [Pelodytes ibericus]